MQINNSIFVLNTTYHSAISTKRFFINRLLNFLYKNQESHCYFRHFFCFNRINLQFSVRGNYFTVTIFTSFCFNSFLILKIDCIENLSPPLPPFYFLYTPYLMPVLSVKSSSQNHFFQLILLPKINFPSHLSVTSVSP